jgi:hypothetical protein
MISDLVVRGPRSTDGDAVVEAHVDERVELAYD